MARMFSIFSSCEVTVRIPGILAHIVSPRTIKRFLVLNEGNSVFLLLSLRGARFLAYASEQAPQSRRLRRSRLPARRMTPAGEPSPGLLALKLQRRQAGRSLAMTMGCAQRQKR